MFLFQFFFLVETNDLLMFFKGDCKNNIHLWEPTSGATWNVDTTPYIGHIASVEDLQVCS